MKRQIILAAVVALTLGVMLAIFIDVQGRNIALDITVQAYKERFAQRLGDDDVYGSYKILTLDGGLMWWEFDTNELQDGSKAVLIVRRADDGLVRRLNKRDKDGETH